MIMLTTDLILQTQKLGLGHRQAGTKYLLKLPAPRPEAASFGARGGGQFATCCTNATVEQHNDIKSAKTDDVNLYNNDNIIMTKKIEHMPN